MRITTTMLLFALGTALSCDSKPVPRNTANERKGFEDARDSVPSDTGPLVSLPPADVGVDTAGDPPDTYGVLNAYEQSECAHRVCPLSCAKWLRASRLDSERSLAEALHPRTEGIARYINKVCLEGAALTKRECERARTTLKATAEARVKELEKSPIVASGMFSDDLMSGLEAVDTVVCGENSQLIPETADEVCRLARPALLARWQTLNYEASVIREGLSKELNGIEGTEERVGVVRAVLKREEDQRARAAAVLHVFAAACGSAGLATEVGCAEAEVARERASTKATFTQLMARNEIERQAADKADAEAEALAEVKRRACSLVPGH